MPSSTLSGPFIENHGVPSEVPHWPKHWASIRRSYDDFSWLNNMATGLHYKRWLELYNEQRLTLYGYKRRSQERFTNIYITARRQLTIMAVIIIIKINKFYLQSIKNLLLIFFGGNNNALMRAAYYACSLQWWMRHLSCNATWTLNHFVDVRVPVSKMIDAEVRSRKGAHFYRIMS